MKKMILMVLLFAPLSIFAQKFGHFNSATIIQLMPEYISLQKEVQGLRKTYEDELKRMNDELNKKGEEFNKQADSLPENVRQRRQQELQELYARIQQSAQDNQQSLEKTYGEKMQGITTKVLNVVKELGTSGGYVYIMDVSSGIPYISTTLSTDITATLKAKLGLK